MRILLPYYIQLNAIARKASAWAQHWSPSLFSLTSSHTVKATTSFFCTALYAFSGSDAWLPMLRCPLSEIEPAAAAGRSCQTGSRKPRSRTKFRQNGHNAQEKYGRAPFSETARTADEELQRVHEFQGKGLSCIGSKGWYQHFSVS